MKLKDTNRVEGVMLEGIPFTSYGAQPGVALVHRDWDNIYLLKERKEWKEEDYFDYAQSRFLDLKIMRP